MKKRNKMIAKVMALLMVLSTAFVVAFGSNAVKADDPTANSVFDGTTGSDIFKDTTQVAKEAGNSAKSLIMTVAIIILVIGAIIVGLQFTNKNSAKRQEAKGNLVALIVGAVIVFAAVAIIAFSGSIADSLNESLNPTVTSGP